MTPQFHRSERACPEITRVLRDRSCGSVPAGRL